MRIWSVSALAGVIFLLVASAVVAIAGASLDPVTDLAGRAYLAWCSLLSG